jgi:Acetyltransferase (GNAT) family
MNTNRKAARPQPTSTVDYAITTVGPDDRAALCDLFRRSSVDTRYARFHHMVADFPHQYLADVTCTRCPHLALAARPDGADMVGLASASIAGPDTAEIAVWVRDDWQHRHVGTTLVTELLHRLTDAGLTSATAIVATSNTGARALIEKLAPHATTRRLDLATLEVRIPLQRPSSAAREPRPRIRRAVQLTSLLTGTLLVMAGCAIPPPTSLNPAAAAEDELSPLIV